jgi:hypothetical protein
MSASRRALALALIAALPAPARADAPLSAIDWLSKSVAEPVRPVAMPLPPQTPRTDAPAIAVTPLDRAPLDGIGLLSPAKTGLPARLWGPTPLAEALRIVKTERTDLLPELQSLVQTVLLAEAEPPSGSGANGDSGTSLFLARIDRLLDLGALDPALSMLELPPKLDPESFRRRFDAALLLGQEDDACKAMRDNPQIAPSFPARIFCLARGGDWQAAALSLRTGEALGFIAPGDAALLTRFLDPDLAEGQADLPYPDKPSPLTFRMMEAIGQPMVTTELPLAFAQADLRSNSGWKTRIEAAERLAKTGAIEANALLGLYTERAPAASGGVWDRVAAIRDLDAAIAAGDRNAAAIALPVAWSQMAAVELEVPLSEIYGERAAQMRLDGEAGALAFRMGLLSSAFEAVARNHPADPGQTARDRLLTGIALGDTGTSEAGNELEAAIRAAFAGAPVPDPASVALLDDGRTAEAILHAADSITAGALGNTASVTDGLAVLRKAGLDAVARRTALELLLLERRG